MTCPDAHRLRDTDRAFPHTQTEQGALSRKPGWGYFCVGEVLKEKTNLGVRFGIQLVKGISNYPNSSTSECLIRATCASLSWGFGAAAKKYGKEKSHPRSPGCISKHALSTNPPNDLRLKSSVTSYGTNPTGPLGRHYQHRRNAATSTLSAHPRSTSG